MLHSVQLVVRILVVSNGSFLLVVATLQRVCTGAGRTHLASCFEKTVKLDVIELYIAFDITKQFSILRFHITNKRSSVLYLSIRHS